MPTVLTGLWGCDAIEPNYIWFKVEADMPLLRVQRFKVCKSLKKSGWFAATWLPARLTDLEDGPPADDWQAVSQVSSAKYPQSHRP